MVPRRRYFVFSGAVLACLLWLSLGNLPKAQALVIIETGAADYGDPLANTTAPDGFPYWSNIQDNRIHVGNGHYLRTRHAIGGPLSGSQTLLKFETGSTENSDIVAETGTIEVEPVVPIITSPVTVGEQLLIVGDGHRRADDLTFWDVTYNASPSGSTTANDVWSETLDEGDAEAVGFKVSGSNADKRWGTNEVSVPAIDVETDPNVVTKMFVTSFNLTGGTPWEAQGSNNDSDGVAFVFRDGEWQLAGLIHAVAGIDESQDPVGLIGIEGLPTEGGLPAITEYQTSLLNEDDPPGTYTSATLFSDLSFYNDQLSVLGFGFALPEPGTGLLFFMLGAIGLTARRRTVAA